MNINYINSANTTKYHDFAVPYISSRLLDEIDFIRHGFSTRLGGVSTDEYTSMNLSFSMNDSKENVLNNFRLMGEALHINVEDMVYSKQTHTTNILKAASKHKGMGILKDRDYDNIDGLITNEQGLCLVTSYADCVPIFVVDVKNRAIGLFHSGWRGTVNNITAEGISMMKQEYGTNPADIKAFIGPSICRNCYEIGEDVATEFIVRYGEKVFDDILYPKDDQKFLLDLHKANFYNLTGCGVLACNISATDICTCCNPNLLFSHRATKGKRGGMCAFLEIK